MVHNRDTTPKPERRGAGLAARLMGTLLLASAVVLLLGAAAWWILRTLRHEIEASRLAADGGNAAAMAGELLGRVDIAGWLLIAGVCLGLALVAGLYLYCTRVIVRPLRIQARLMGRLAVGDVGEGVPAGQLARNDEIGDLARAFQGVIAHQREEAGIANDMSAGNFTGVAAVRDPADELGLAIRRIAGVTIETLRRVNAHAGEVTAGCEAIASASGELSANSAGITSAVTEISTGIARIRTHATDNAGMAEQAGRLADSGCQSVDRGYEDVGEMGAVMLNMQACGDKIVRIAKSIGDIAFQTNLLALNASVEAARAGRNGKGFTVVAEEVRSLAVRSKRAADETSTLMQETVEQVELAAAIAGRINATFSEMQANTQEADSLLTKIAAASREQSGGIDQISAALRRMDQSAQDNMGHIGDVSEKADNLVRQTDRLSRMLGRFRLNFGRSPNFESFGGSDAPSPGALLPRAIRHVDPEYDAEDSESM